MVEISRLIREEIKIINYLLKRTPFDEAIPAGERSTQKSIISESARLETTSSRGRKRAVSVCDWLGCTFPFEMSFNFRRIVCTQAL